MEDRVPYVIGGWVRIMKEWVTVILEKIGKGRMDDRAATFKCEHLYYLNDSCELLPTVIGALVHAVKHDFTVRCFENIAGLLSIAVAAAKNVPAYEKAEDPGYVLMASVL